MTVVQYFIVKGEIVGKDKTFSFPMYLNVPIT